MDVICDYCKNPAELVDSKEIYGRSYGMAWLCRSCDAWVGCHKNSKKQHAPLGRLANAELRKWKIRAHAAFDPLWKSGEMKRAQAYKIMAEILNIPTNKAHIGMLDVGQCKKLVDALKWRL